MMPSMAPISSGDDQVQVLRHEYLKCLQTILGATTGEEEASSTNTTPASSLPRRCPRAWDGILCWDEAEPGDLAVLPCPAYVAGFDVTANATRQCMEDGQWQLNPKDSEATWTNFSKCSPPNYITTIVVPFSPLAENASFDQWIPVVKTMSKVGYSVSLITLVVAFTIMASIKKLRCPRNMLHMHLFASFMMRAFMSLLKDKLFIEGVDVSSKAFLHSPDGILLLEEEHSWECKLVIGLWEFFIMANYSWVLMEGLYLHNLIFLALFSDTSAITLYVIIGWGLPVLVIVPWVVLRAVLEDTLCWTTHDNWWFFLVIRVPTTATVLINFVLFVNIVRVLLLKLRSSICEETRKYRYRRWAKSTLVLVPLFGVHYTLFLGMYYASVNHVVEIIWLFCDQFFASFQGSFVAILYCFMNGEVRAELTKIWLHHCKGRHRGGGADGKAQWWLSSGYADGASSSRRTSRALLSSFPRKSRDLGKKASEAAVAKALAASGGAHTFSKGGGVLARQSPPSMEGSPPGGGVLAPTSCWKERGKGLFGVRRLLARRWRRRPPAGVGAKAEGGCGNSLWQSRYGAGGVRGDGGPVGRGGGGRGGAVGRVNGSSPYTSAVSFSCHTTHCSIDYGGGGGGGEDLAPALWPPLLSVEQGPEAHAAADTTSDKSDRIPLRVESTVREEEEEEGGGGWRGDEMETIAYMDVTQNTTL